MKNQTSTLSDADLDLVTGGLDGCTDRSTGATAGGGPGPYGPNADCTKGGTKGVSGMDLGSGR